VGAWSSAADLTLLFDCRRRSLAERIAAQARDLDRFEQERADFHERVRLAYLERAAAAAPAHTVIDADQAPDIIENLIQKAIVILVYEHN
jgi:dTMP kinase